MWCDENHHKMETLGGWSCGHSSIISLLIALWNWLKGPLRKGSRFPDPSRNRWLASTSTYVSSALISHEQWRRIVNPLQGKQESHSFPVEVSSKTAPKQRKEFFQAINSRLISNALMTCFPLDIL